MAAGGGEAGSQPSPVAPGLWRSETSWGTHSFFFFFFLFDYDSLLFLQFTM